MKTLNPSVSAISSASAAPLFDAENPYPLLPLERVELMSAKEHARQTDDWLGFQIEKVEVAVKENRFGEELAPFETWAHISPQVFLTPYLELRYWLEKLNPAPASTVVDLGAGYGRLAFVLEHCFPGLRFIGVECVRARVEEFIRVSHIQNLKNSCMMLGDLTDEKFPLPFADIYFVYDCGTREAVEKVIARLGKEAKPGCKLLVRGLRACQSARDSNLWQAASDFDYRQAPGLHAEIFIRI
jgi:hypothetical protein